MPQDNALDGDFVIYGTGGPMLKGLEYVGERGREQVAGGGRGSL